MPLLLPLPAAFGPVLIFVFRRLLACIFSCAKPITYSPLLIISIVCPMADLWSTAPVALADAPRYVGFRPRLLCLTFPDLPSPCQNSKTSLRMSEDSEVPEVVPECGIKLIIEKTKRPLKRARSLLRFHPEATVLQILRVQDVSGIVASSFEFFDFFNFSFKHVFVQIFRVIEYSLQIPQRKWVKMAIDIYKNPPKNVSTSKKSHSPIICPSFTAF